MNWEHPPIIKIYEALGSIADDRVKVSGNSAKVYSSSGNKFYTVKFDPKSASIMTNDNGSFYKGYLGYPAIAYLMCIGELPYSKAVAQMLKDIKWKDINQEFKNDFGQTLASILAKKTIEEKGALISEVEEIDRILRTRTYSLLGPKIQPPEGY